MNQTINAEDTRILRELAKRKLELVHDPLNVERRNAWYAHQSGDSSRPMILAEFAAIVDERRPFMPELRCVGELARHFEYVLKSEIWRFEWLRDDYVLEPAVNVAWDVSISDYGVQTQWETSSDAGALGAKRWDAPVGMGEVGQLHPRTYSVSKETSLERKAVAEDIFLNLLSVRFRGTHWWTMGMTQTAVYLIGLENLMLWMYDDPDGLHRLMRFLCDDHLDFINWYEREGLFTLNDENDYVGSGSMGYTKALPQPDCKNGDPVRSIDCWVLLESQETVGVSPELFDEFVLQYQKEIGTRFGLTYYGCCEPVHHRWEVLKTLPNLRSVSISPWCDERFMAEALRRDYVYSRKPSPTLISTGVFDEEEIRADIRKTLTVAKGCRIELIMKDVHTLNNQPERLQRWVEIAREESA